MKRTNTTGIRFLRPLEKPTQVAIINGVIQQIKKRRLNPIN
jgi:hypothetical protein